MLLYVRASFRNPLSGLHLVLSTLCKVHSSEGGQDGELSWCLNTVVGIMTRTSRTVQVLAALSDGRHLVVPLNLHLQTSFQQTIAVLPTVSVSCRC